MRARTFVLSSLTALGIIVGAVELNNATTPAPTVTANGPAQSPPTPVPSATLPPTTNVPQPTVAPTVSPPVTTKTITGDTVNTQYGDVQIEATVTGTKITDIKALKTPDQDNHSRRIASFAIPQLISETLTNQNSNISNVSGATYTSEGFKSSLQSILNKLGK